MIVSLQIEFQLRVAVCAWCKPKNRGVDLGTGLGSISHGICPRHLRKIQLELQMRKDGGHPSLATAAHLRRRGAAFDHPELAYQVG